MINNFESIVALIGTNKSYHVSSLGCFYIVYLYAHPWLDPYVYWHHHVPLAVNVETEKKSMCQQLSQLKREVRMGIQHDVTQQ